MKDEIISYPSVAFYNLDEIISVGSRVKSKPGTQFRIWATNVLRDYLLKGYALNQRMYKVENNVENLTKKVDAISFRIQSNQIAQASYTPIKKGAQNTFAQALLARITWYHQLPCKKETVAITKKFTEPILDDMIYQSEQIKNENK